MRKLIISSAVIIALTGGAVIAKTLVNGQEISEARITAHAQDLAMQAQSQGQQVDPKALQNEAAEQLIGMELVSQEAVKQGLDQNPQIVAKLANLRTNILAQAFAEQYLKNNPVSEAEIKAFYEKEVPAVTQYKAQHILLKTEADALAVIDAIKKGKSFNKLAQEKSEDPTTKKEGGDLGWQEAQLYTPAFAEALSKLSSGEITAKPVKTEFGWHVIRLADKRQQRPALEELRPKLAQYLTGQKIQQLITSLKAKAKIEK